MTAQAGNEKKDIWYKLVKQTDYNTISQIGVVTIQIRILPGFNSGRMYEAVFEKDTSTSKYPNTKKWILPALILSDPIHPEYNGQVRVMDISKTLHKAIVGKGTPPNYFDLNQGFNFNIVVELQQSKDGSQWFPNYAKSYYDNTPTQVNQEYVLERMNAMQISDFAEFTRKLNEYFTKKNQDPAPVQGYVSPQATTPPSDYSSGAAPVQPVQQAAPVPQQGFQQPAAPVAPPVQPVAPQPVAPQPMAQPVAQAAPVNPNAIPMQPSPQVPAPPVDNAEPTQASGNEDFDKIFGSPQA